MLPPRLTLVHDINPSSSDVADVGCDHGLLGTALLMSGKAKRIINADVNKLAEERVTQSINHYAPQHASKLDVRVGDGLKPLEQEDGIDVITMAGIGLPRMHGILFEGANTPAMLQVQTLVLQPLQFRVDRLAALHQRLWADGFAVQEQRFLAPAGFKGPAVLTLRAELRAAALPKQSSRRPTPPPTPTSTTRTLGLRERADATPSTPATYATRTRAALAARRARERPGRVRLLPARAKGMLNNEISGLRRAEHRRRNRGRSGLARGLHRLDRQTSKYWLSGMTKYELIGMLAR